MSIQGALPQKLYHVFHHHYKDPAPLFFGVAYQCDDKVWNVQIGWSNATAKKTQHLFIRIYSEETLYGVKIWKTDKGFRYNFMMIDKEKCSPFIDKKYNDHVEKMVDRFLQSPKLPKQIPPTFPKKWSDYLGNFFKDCPDLNPL